jgi:hypothetical protein
LGFITYSAAAAAPPPPPVTREYPSADRLVAVLLLNEVFQNMTVSTQFEEAVCDVLQDKDKYFEYISRICVMMKVCLVRDCTAALQ